jgi:dienelactone hydrolase
MRRPLVLVVLLVAAAPSWNRTRGDSSSDLQEQVVTLPVTLQSSWGGRQTRDLYLTVFRPKGKGPFPLVVINHGRSSNRDQRASPRYQRFESASRYFLRKGFVVLVPTRVGYGATGQDFDPEDSGPNTRKDYRLLLDAATTQVLAAIEYGRGLPEVDPGRIVLVGQSVGGFTTVATAARNPPGVVAVINFAGGAGGDPDQHPGVPAAAGQLEDLFAEMGKQVRVPMLWVYTENDRFFDAAHSRAWAKAYSGAGGQLDFRLLPPFQENGHRLFEHGCDIWMPLVEEYLDRAGFREPGLVRRPPPTRFAAVGEVDKLPRAGSTGREGYLKFLQSAVPRAFALSGDGHWGFANGDDAPSRALAHCQRNSPAATCRLYAVDSEVVW